jgi:predicted ATPase/DNA-binding XRE family transcriptional regulator
MSSDSPLAGLLRELRADRRMSQAELADAAHISERAVSDIERGLRTRIYPATAAALADALGLTDDVRAAFLGAAQAGRRRAVSSPASGAIWRSLLRDSLVGRKRELAELAADSHRLHTITGPGGVGKSRLAAELCARTDAHRVRWVALADVDGVDGLRPAIAAAVGLPADVHVAAIADALDDVAALLVLDTFERVLAAAGLVAELLDHTSRTRVLVTSRSPLRLRGERLLPLAPLDQPEAVRLLQDRASAVQPGLPADDAEYAEVAAQLSGLPLAIELAAAKLRHVSLSTLRELLLRPLDVLGDGPRDLPPRQQAMRTTIRWSYELLDEADRRSFRRLGQFAGSWDLPMATALLDGDPFDRLGRLCDQALVQPDPVASDELGRPAWRMLDPIREFAMEHLLASGEASEVRRTHARLTAEAADAAAASLLGTDQGRGRAQLQVLLPNVRAAFGWSIEAGDADLALRIAGTMWMFWRMVGRFTEGRQALTAALALPGAHGSAHRPRALWAAGWLAYHQNDQASAARYAEELLAAAGEDPMLRRNAATLLGNLAMAERRFDDAVRLLDEALALARTAGSEWHVAASLLNLGTATLHDDELETAERLLDEAKQAFEEVGDRHFVARCILELGYGALVGNDDRGARRWFAAALSDFVGVAEQWGAAEAIVGLAAVAALRADVETAALLTGATDRIYADIGVQLNAPDAALVARVLAEARSASTWAAAQEEGRGLSLEDAAAVALDRVAE